MKFIGFSNEDLSIYSRGSSWDFMRVQPLPSGNLT
jgi:hypothetical protein